MFSFLEKIVHIVNPNNSIIVDYSTPLYIPRDADGVHAHKPLGIGKMEINFSKIKLEKIPFGMCAQDYILSMPKDTRFCDAKVLDALTTNNVKNNRLVNPKKTRKLISQLGGGKGPVYFLGTTFDGGKLEYVAVLSRNPSTALRYLILFVEPITSLEDPSLRTITQIITGKKPSSAENFAAVYVD